MQSSSNSYLDWKDFFKQKFTSAGIFSLTEHRKEGKTEVEIYTSSVPGVKTSIEIGYKSPQRILFLRILNPFTPGLNKHQVDYHFDANALSHHFTQEGNGLEFDNFNVRGIDEYLSNGFHGTETVYLRNGKPFKSILKTNSFPWTSDTLTFYFEKTHDNKEFSEDKSLEQAFQFDLHEIYPGTNRS